MFAGKTEEFIRRLRRYGYARKRVISFKPSIDTRYDVNAISTHTGTKFACYTVGTSQEIRTIFEEQNAQQKVNVVGIDEVQFLDSGIVELINEFADNGIIVVVAGLDKDFRSQPFKNVDKLLVMAEYVDKLSAICQQCGQFASNSQRLESVPSSDDKNGVVLVGADETYEARCRNCYVRPK